MGRKRRAKNPHEWGLLAASTTVLLSGVALTVSVWIGLTWLLRHHWPWQHAERVATPATPLDVTKVALSVVAGIGAAVALTVTYRRQRDVERGRFDERLAAGAAQLGGHSAAERMAGVYTVAALADETPTRRQRCIDLLCAYLRLDYEPSGGLLRTVTREQTWNTVTGTGREERTYERLPNDRDVRTTIITVIREHLQPGGSWIGYDFNFAGAVFDGGNFDGAEWSSGVVYFDHAKFVEGSFSFDRVQFTGTTVYFNHAEFLGARVYFNDARFATGTVRFSDAHFVAGHVSFDGAHFDSGRVNFKRAKFIGSTVTLNEARYAGAELSFEKAEFNGGTVAFGLASGPVPPSKTRSVVSFRGAIGRSEVVDLGDLSQVCGVTGPDGQAPTQPHLFA